MTLSNIHLHIQDFTPKPLRPSFDDITEAIRSGAYTIPQIRDIAACCVDIVGGEVSITIQEIEDIVCGYFDVDKELLHTNTRKRPVVNARQITMYFAKKYTKLSFQRIGDYFNGFDHTTIIHSCQTVEDLMDSDKEYLND